MAAPGPDRCDVLVIAGFCASRHLQEPLPPTSSYPAFDQLPPDDSEAWLREEGEQLEEELRRRQEEQEAHAAGKRVQREAAGGWVGGWVCG